MFEISWSELFIVAAVAIIVVGPKELPGMLRSMGRIIGQLRRTAGDFQRTFSDALREAERQANVEKMKKDMDVRSVDPTADLRKGFDDLKRSMSGRPTDAAPSPTAVATATPVPPPAADAAAPVPPPPVAAAPVPPPPVAAASAPPPPVAAGPVAPATVAAAPAATSPAPAELAELPRAAGERR